ncbi:glycoside hydrolase family 51 protein [Roridomyces roridus]|uniref:non-reducing end alpha-L-arabinofuranosidase n=1 Tax=Roridomyces roridus TaxID=1738132 RepID=A0AAD7C8K0_9AGAR|nr:glycoside hydrolase family 51 protein [Roridomyces roridus]
MGFLPSLVLGLTITASRVFAATKTVSVSASASHAIPTSLLLQNRAFQQVDTANATTALVAWSPVGKKASISVIKDPSPLSSALPNSLVLSVPPLEIDEVGFANEGYWGINVEANKSYTASLYYHIPPSPFALFTLGKTPTLTLALQAADGTRVASFSTPLKATKDGEWTKVSAVLTPRHTPASTKNLFVVTVKDRLGLELLGYEVHFALMSLFPPTFKGRENGMRADIAETLAELNPTFFRFPGGNNLEGQTVDTRWRWRDTVGPLTERPGRMGDWGYPNTDGLGLLEYLYWCEDMEMELYMAVWDGYSLGGESVTGDDTLAPYIAEAIEQILFVIGDPSKDEPAALRASLGRLEPFKLRYVEIGNEDFVGKGPDTAASRWQTFAANLSATFPQLSFMATGRGEGHYPLYTPTPQAYDLHVYATPEWFAENSFYYDAFERNGTKYFEGEYAVTSTNMSDLYGLPENGRLLWPTVAGSVGEAAFMTGFERNADIVFSAAYAPLLGHVNGSQWTPISLVTSAAGKIYKSTSFYVQKFFANNKGDIYLPSTLPDSSNGTLFWSVTQWNSTGQLNIKIANTASEPADMTFVLPFENVAANGTAQVLTGAASEFNTPEQPDLVVPSTVAVKTGTTFNYTAPGFSVTVITVDVQ